MQKSACQRGRFSVNTSLLLTNASRKRKPNGAAGHRKQSRTSPRQTENLASQHRLQLRVEGFPSGQREQTVNLSSLTSMVRIHLSPPTKTALYRCCFCLYFKFDNAFPTPCVFLYSPLLPRKRHSQTSRPKNFRALSEKIFYFIKKLL